MVLCMTLGRDFAHRLSTIPVAQRPDLAGFGKKQKPLGQQIRKRWEEARRPAGLSRHFFSHRVTDGQTRRN